jgi:hypothetical protein
MFDQFDKYRLAADVDVGLVTVWDFRTCVGVGLPTLVTAAPETTVPAITKAKAIKRVDILPIVLRLSNMSIPQFVKLLH